MSFASFKHLFGFVVCLSAKDILSFWSGTSVHWRRSRRTLIFKKLKRWFWEDIQSTAAIKQGATESIWLPQVTCHWTFNGDMFSQPPLLLPFQNYQTILIPYLGQPVLFISSKLCDISQNSDEEMEACFRNTGAIPVPRKVTFINIYILIFPTSSSSLHSSHVLGARKKTGWITNSLIWISLNSFSTVDHV